MTTPPETSTAAQVIARIQAARSPEDGPVLPQQRIEAMLDALLAADSPEYWPDTERWAAEIAAAIRITPNVPLDTMVDKVRAYALACEAVTTLDAQIDSVVHRVEFNAVCDRWYAWRAVWRRPTESISQAWFETHPNAGIIDAENTSADEIAFEDQDRAGDYRHNIIPVAYFMDPDAWEQKAERSPGEWVHIDVRRAQAAAAEAQAKLVREEVSHVNMAEQLRRAGYTVEGPQ